MEGFLRIFLLFDLYFVHLIFLVLSIRLHHIFPEVVLDICIMARSNEGLLGKLFAVGIFSQMLGVNSLVVMHLKEDYE